MANKSYIRQHIVPRQYLKRFALNNSTTVCVFDKALKSIFTTSTNNIAVEKNFYDIDIKGTEDSKDPKILEKTLSERETEFDHILSDIIDQLDSTATCVIKKDKLAPHLTNQLIRTKRIRNLIIEKAKQNEPKSLDLRYALQLCYGEDYAKVNARYLHNTDLLYKGNIFRIISEKLKEDFKYYYLKNNTNMPFFTSDNPIVVDADSNDSYIGFLNIGEADKKLIYPLNPMYALVLADKYSLKFKDFDANELVIISERSVVHYNKLQIAQSYRQVFCNKKKKFQCALDLLSRYPNIKVLDSNLC